MEENQKNIINKSKKKTSKLALVSFIFIVISVLLLLFLFWEPLYLFNVSFSEDTFISTSIILQCFALFLGIIAISHIKKNKEQLKGKWLAYSSLIIFVLFLGFWFILYSSPRCTKEQDLTIRSDLSEIRTDMEVYDMDNNNSYKGYTTPERLAPPEWSEDDHYIVQISPNGQKYLIYGRAYKPCGPKKDAFWCVDSEGFNGEVVAKSILTDIYTCPK